MATIINPGSHVLGGTQDQARRNAQPFLDEIHEMGMKDVVIDPNPTFDDGRWLFTFRHPVTQKMATLKTHGLSDADVMSCIFLPKIYWNGCSCSDPKISDFLPKDWGFRVVFEPLGGSNPLDLPSNAPCF